MLVSLYIRKSDEDKWRKLPKKTETISRMLRGQQLKAIIVNEDIPAPNMTTDIKTTRASNKSQVDAPEKQKVEPIIYKKTNNWGA